MSKPLVSVVIPCFNVAATVGETIASVTVQTIDDFEIIAVDNNCTDATLQVLSDVTGHEPRLRVIQQPVQGLSAARNAGIAAAEGKYIALLDGDYLWDADYLASHLANLADEGVGISYSRVRMIDFAGQPTGQVTQPQLTGLAAAARIAPELVARNRGLARSGMLRYCARQAMEHNKGTAVARGYLAQMYRAAPDLALREPLQTLKVAAGVLLPGLKAMLQQRASVPRVHPCSGGA